MGEAQKLGYLVNVDTDLRLNKPQLDISIDRDRASQLGASVTDIGGRSRRSWAASVISEFKRGTKQYDVIAQLRPHRRGHARRDLGDLPPRQERAGAAGERRPR